MPSRQLARPVPPADGRDSHDRGTSPSKAGLSWKSFNSTRELLRDTSLWTDPQSWKTLQTSVGPTPILKVLLENIRSAVVIAMVSVALSIGLGIASGASPVAGLRTAIWGGMICGCFGSSPFNVIGPAGALTGMLSTYSAQWGEDILPWIAIFSGIICFAVVSLGLQRYCLLMPKSVFEGFTLAVALMIGLKQINYAFGLTGLEQHENFLENVWESLKNLDKAQWGCMVLFFPETLALFLLPTFLPKVPWMIAIPLCTILCGYLADGVAGWDLPTLKTEFGALPNVVAVLPSTDALLKCDDVMGVMVASASVALVSVLETLISAKIAEFRARENHRGPFDEGQEISALSLAQVVCGVVGALPPTGVFVRTSVNQLNGATHPVSQLLNAVLVLIITALMMPLFSCLPLASVAAVLVISAVRMVPVHFLKHLWRHARAHFFLCLATAAICVVLDRVEGLMYGTLVAYLIAAMRSSIARPAVTVTNAHIENTVGSCRTVVLTGPITYANSDAIVRRGNSEEEGKEDDDGVQNQQVSPSLVMLDLSHVTEMDTDGAEALERLAVLLGRKIEGNLWGHTTGLDAAFGVEGGIEKVVVHSIPHDILKVLQSSPWFLTAQEARRVFATREEALVSHAESLRLASGWVGAGNGDAAAIHLEGMDHPEDVTGISLASDSEEDMGRRLLHPPPPVVV